MNRLPGNPFSGNVGGLMPSEAQAMMALAFEQRTSNLIAYEHIASVDMTDWPTEWQEQWFKRRTELVSRLGLEDR